MPYRARPFHTPLIAIMAAAGLAAGATQAQTGGLHLKPSWYMVPHVSAFDPDDKFGVGGHGAGGGLRFGKPISNDWDVQLVVNHARQSSGGNKIQETLLGVEGLFLLSRGEFQPFLALGVGAVHDDRTRNGVNTDGTSPYVSAGAGARWMFTDTFGLQLDYRRVQGFQRSSTWGFNRAGSNYYNLGLVWNFGVPTPPAPKIVQAPPPPKVVAPPPPPPKIEAAPPPPPVVKPKPIETMTLDAKRLFELNSARIVPPVPELDKFAEALNANPQVANVVITGHTDQLGTATYNQGLSQRRAEAVKAYLVGKGVAANRLSARGVGSTQLVVNCKEKTRAAMIQCGEPNRRVVVEPITVTKR